MNNIFNHSHFKFIDNELFIKKDWLESQIEIEIGFLKVNSNDVAQKKSFNEMNHNELIAYHLLIIKALINGMDEGR